MSDVDHFMLGGPVDHAWPFNLGSSGSQWPDDADLACLYSFSIWVNDATVQIKCSVKKEKTDHIEREQTTRCRSAHADKDHHGSPGGR
jgi:hypothetical protein